MIFVSYGNSASSTCSESGTLATYSAQYELVQRIKSLFLIIAHHHSSRVQGASPILHLVHLIISQQFEVCNAGGTHTQIATMNDNNRQRKDTPTKPGGYDSEHGGTRESSGSPCLKEANDKDEGVSEEPTGKDSEQHLNYCVIN